MEKSQLGLSMLMSSCLSAGFTYQCQWKMDLTLAWSHLSMGRLLVSSHETSSETDTIVKTEASS
jgi:predicted oxidoreductase